jgi:hypothetical protein
MACACGGRGGERGVRGVVFRFASPLPSSMRSEPETRSSSAANACILSYLPPFSSLFSFFTNYCLLQTATASAWWATGSPPSADDNEHEQLVADPHSSVCSLSLGNISTSATHTQCLQYASPLLAYTQRLEHAHPRGQHIHPPPVRAAAAARHRVQASDPGRTTYPVGLPLKTPRWFYLLTSHQPLPLPSFLSKADGRMHRQESCPSARSRLSPPCRTGKQTMLAPLLCNHTETLPGARRGGTLGSREQSQGSRRIRHPCGWCRPSRPKL